MGSRMKRYDLNLFKVISNAQLVRQAYPPKEPLPEVVNLQPNDANNPAEESTSLGLQWHIKQDTFSIKTEHKICPKTKRGFLSHTMAVYDPQGIAAPLMLTCKLLQRELFPPKDEDPHHTHGLGWDEPIPAQFHKQWDKMIATCKETEDLFIPRPFYPPGHGTPIQQQLHAFADASDLAWCYVIYLRTVTTDKQVHVAFVCGNNKVLPKGVCVKGQLSIPRAELNAAFDLAKKVLDVEQAVDLPKDICLPTILYSDSQDVLAWVKNGTTKEPISRYIASRVTTITNITRPSQWEYIPTKDNPADIGTRPVSADNLKASPWLTGPPFLHHENPQTPTKPISPTTNIAYLITAKSPKLNSYFNTKHRHAFEEITSGDSWKTLLNNQNASCQTPNLAEASIKLQKQMQGEAWPKGLDSFKTLEPRKRAEILAKSPFLDQEDGLIKVGGRLTRADLSFGRKHPTLVPDTELGDALLGYLHANSHHQGRKISSSAILERT